MDKNLKFALNSIIETKSLNQSFRDSVKREKEELEKEENV